LIGERVIVEGRGEGVLEYYGRVRKGQTDHGKVMCGIELDDRVASAPPTLLPCLLLSFRVEVCSCFGTHACNGSSRRRPSHCH
jgi:hypothetical protein